MWNMSVPPNVDLVQLKNFVKFCTSKPSVLHQPDLAFVKEFIESFGGNIPKDNGNSSDNREKTTKKPPENQSQPEAEPENDDSDLELDMTGVIEPDTDPHQEMGDPNLEPSDELIADSQAKRSEAVSAFMEQDYTKAIQLYTEAIVLNPQAALLYAKRGQTYLFLHKPNACIRDCQRALELNPDSAAAHKFRGRAHQMLGNWIEAANDLRLACKFDFDEQADEWLREVTPNASKIEQHNRKQDRKAQEKLTRERQERIKNAKEAAKAREADKNSTDSSGGGADNMADFSQFLKDPELFQAFQDPEVSQVFKDVCENPANLAKYHSNPKIMSLINKMAAKFGGPGGMPGMPGMPGGMPGFPSGGANQSPSAPQDDVGLD